MKFDRRQTRLAVRRAAVAARQGRPLARREGGFWTAIAHGNRWWMRQVLLAVILLFFLSVGEESRDIAEIISSEDITKLLMIAGFWVMGRGLLRWFRVGEAFSQEAFASLVILPVSAGDLRDWVRTFVAKAWSEGIFEAAAIAWVLSYHADPSVSWVIIVARTLWIQAILFLTPAWILRSSWVLLLGMAWVILPVVWALAKIIGFFAEAPMLLSAAFDIAQWTMWTMPTTWLFLVGENVVAEVLLWLWLIGGLILWVRGSAFSSRFFRDGFNTPSHDELELIPAKGPRVAEQQDNRILDEPNVQPVSVSPIQNENPETAVAREIAALRRGELEGWVDRLVWRALTPRCRSLLPVLSDTPLSLTKKLRIGAILSVVFAMLGWMMEHLFFSTDGSQASGLFWGFVMPLGMLAQGGFPASNLTAKALKLLSIGRCSIPMAFAFPVVTADLEQFSTRVTWVRMAVFIPLMSGLLALLLWSSEMLPHWRIAFGWMLGFSLMPLLVRPLLLYYRFQLAFRGRGFLYFLGTSVCVGLGLLGIGLAGLCLSVCVNLMAEKPLGLPWWTIPLLGGAAWGVAKAVLALYRAMLRGRSIDLVKMID